MGASYELAPMETGYGNDAGPYAPEKTLATLLTRFAERSARAHGCDRVQLEPR